MNINKIVEIIQKIKITRKNIVIFMLLLILFLILLPLINKLFLIPIQINQKINLYKELVFIASNDEENEILFNLRTLIFDDIKLLQTDNVIIFDFFELYKNNRIKFYTGIVIPLLICFLLLFQKDKLHSKFFGIIIMALIGFIAGYIGMLIPNIVSPKVNYIGYPIIQIIILVLIAYAPRNKMQN
jgi:hypothetical protein